MKLKKYLSIIGIFLFIYILIKINIKNLFLEMSKANYFYVFLAIVLLIPVLILQTFKWYIIAQKQKITIPFFESFIINLKSNFYGFITPARLGTAIRAEYLREKAGGRGRGFSNFVLDKLLDLWSIVFIVIFFVLLIDGKTLFSLFWFYLLIFITALFTSTFIFIKKERARRVAKTIYKTLIPERFKIKAKKGFESFYTNMPKPRNLPIFLFFNLLYWILIYLISYLIALSFGMNISFIYFLAIAPIGTLVAFIPISFNGLGTKEATLILLFGMFNIPPAKVVSMSLGTLLIISVLPVILAGILILLEKPNQ